MLRNWMGLWEVLGPSPSEDQKNKNQTEGLGGMMGGCIKF